MLFVLYNMLLCVCVCVYGFEVKEGWLSTDVMLKIPSKIPNLSLSPAYGGSMTLIGSKNKRKCVCVDRDVII